MREVLILAVHFLVTVAKLLRPGGMRAVAAESLLLKHQLLISNRCRKRAPNLTTVDLFVLGLTTVVRNNSHRGHRDVRNLQTRSGSGMMSAWCSWREHSSG